MAHNLTYHAPFRILQRLTEAEPSLSRHSFHAIASLEILSARDHDVATDLFRTVLRNRTPRQHE